MFKDRIHNYKETSKLFQQILMESNHIKTYLEETNTQKLEDNDLEQYNQLITKFIQSYNKLDTEDKNLLSKDIEKGIPNIIKNLEPIKDNTKIQEIIQNLENINNNTNANNTKTSKIKKISSELLNKATEKLAQRLNNKDSKKKEFSPNKLHQAITKLKQKFGKREIPTLTTLKLQDNSRI